MENIGGGMALLGRFGLAVGWNKKQPKKQDFLNGPVKDCGSQSYTDCFKTKRQFITKNANVTKFDSFIYCNP